MAVRIALTRSCRMSGISLSWLAIRPESEMCSSSLTSAVDRAGAVLGELRMLWGARCLERRELAWDLRFA